MLGVRRSRGLETRSSLQVLSSWPSKSVTGGEGSSGGGGGDDFKEVRRCVSSIEQTNVHVSARRWNRNKVENQSARRGFPVLCARRRFA